MPADRTAAQKILATYLGGDFLDTPIGELLVRDFTSAIRTAEDAVRERCAEIADAEARHYNSERIKANEHSSYATEHARISFHAKRDEAENIAALIRSREADDAE